MCPSLLLAIFLKPGESDSICQKLHKIISAAVKFIDLSPIIYDFVRTKSRKKDDDHIYFLFQESSLHGVAPLCCSGLALGLDQCKTSSYQNLFLLSSLSLLPWVWTNVKSLHHHHYRFHPFFFFVAINHKMDNVYAQKAFANIYKTNFRTPGSKCT